MEQILLPNTIEFKEGERPHVGQLVVTPCHKGYGTTIGNALRRVLLSSLPGSAVESIKINGVDHEFSALEGIQEDVVEIILNMKQVAVRCFSDEPVTVSLKKKGKGDVTVADFEKNADIEIVNPEMKIATITDSDITFEMEMTIAKGRGYVPVSEKDTKDLDLGVIAIDSLYSPIRDVGYKVENTRVGDVTDYEKLTLTIETNGTISMEEAVEQAVKIIMDHFALVMDKLSTGASKKTEEDKKEPEKKDDAEKATEDDNKDEE